MDLRNVFPGLGTIDPPRVTVVTAPAVEPWLATDAEVLSFLKLESGVDDAVLTLALAAARKHFERLTGLALITQQLKVSYDRLPRDGCAREIALPRSPLQTVEAFEYLDEEGVLTTFNEANYTVGNAGVPTTFGRVWLNDGASWPEIGSFPGAVQITFTAGFGDAATDIPEEIRLTLLWLAAHWYENRLPSGEAASATELPFHLREQIDSHRVAHCA